MSKISPRELCQRLKSEITARQAEGEDNDLRLSILDYFISHNPSADIFEKALKTRLDDPNPDKEQSKIICSEILEAWQTRTNASP